MATIKTNSDYHPTHKQLVRRMAQWSKVRRNSAIVVTELSTAAGETPDLIVWQSGAVSTLVEVKVSISDFLADKNKFFRRQEDYGMGDYRYYAAPRGLIKPEELPEGWGLFDITEYRVYETVQPKRKDCNKRKECLMLMSALRRLEIGCAVFIRSESEFEKEPVEAIEG